MMQLVEETLSNTWGAISFGYIAGYVVATLQRIGER